KAEAARSELLNHVGRTKLRDIITGEGGGAHDRGAGWDNYLHAVDGERYLLLRVRSRCAVIGLVNERHNVLLLRLGQARVDAEIFGEMGDCAQDGIGGEASKCTERAEFESLAEIFEECELQRCFDTGTYLIEGLNSPLGADTAWRALAAAFKGAKLEGEARLLEHVDGIVEDDDAAMADEPV